MSLEDVLELKCTGTRTR